MSQSRCGDLRLKSLWKLTEIRWPPRKGSAKASDGILLVEYDPSRGLEKQVGRTHQEVRIDSVLKEARDPSVDNAISWGVGVQRG